LRFLETDTIPNILLSGANGTCKRTLAKLLVSSYLNNDRVRACLIIDGAIYRGKDVISCNDSKKKPDKVNYFGATVTEFCKTRLTLPEGKKKIILIYNFEDMTSDAQNALRRIIETNIETSRFILICNEICNIIEPIQSRCTPLTTRPLTDIDCEKVINHMQMGHLDAEIKRTILMLSNGDIKKLINYLQLCFSITDITIDKFYSIFNIPSVRYIEDILKNCHKDVHAQLTYLIQQGYGYSDILEMLGRIITKTEVIPLEHRVKCMEILTKYYTRISAMVSPIHLYAMFGEFSEAINV
jgi:DNA polymerase III delta prime subunit